MSARTTVGYSRTGRVSTEASERGVVLLHVGPHHEPIELDPHAAHVLGQGIIRAANRAALASEAPPAEQGAGAA